MDRLLSVSFDQWPYLAVCAHRGAGKFAPENTLEAFEYGASLGHRMFEFDVKLSADDISFLLHDDTLDRTTSGVGSAASFSMLELEQMDAGVVPAQAGGHFQISEGHTIRLPRFNAIAHWLLRRGFLANVEIKPSKGREAQTGAQVARECWALWNAFAQELPATSLPLVPPLLSSFSEVALAAARDAVPELPRALLLDSLPVDWLAKCQALEVVAVDTNFRVLTPVVIATAKAHKLRVVSYTINDPDVLQRLRAAGLDCAITDRVDLFNQNAPA
jgi:glycerophosphoryl diester phosphodiesterase